MKEWDDGSNVNKLYFSDLRAHNNRLYFAHFTKLSQNVGNQLHVNVQKRNSFPCFLQLAKSYL